MGRYASARSLLAGYRVKLLTTCSLASMVVALPALGDVIVNPSLTATGQIQFGNPLSTFGTYQDGPRPDSVDIIPYAQSGSNHGFIHTYGSAGGFFGARSSGAGDYAVTSTFSYKGEMQGVAGTHGFLSFTITDGEVLATDQFSAGNANAFARSKLSIDILSSGDGDGRAAFFAAEQSTSTAGGSTKTTSNENINLVLTSVDGQQYWDSGLSFPGFADGYSWGAQSFTVDLGTFDASGVLSFEYVMTALSEGYRGDNPNTAELTRNIFVGDYGYGEGYGYGPSGQCREQPIEGNGGGVAAAFFATGSSCQGPFEVVYTENSFGIARSGDPFNGHLPGLDPNALNFAPTVGPNVFGPAAVDVPEPATMALLGAGLAGLLLARRRKSATPEDDAGF